MHIDTIWNDCCENFLGKNYRSNGENFQFWGEIFIPENRVKWKGRTKIMGSLNERYFGIGKINSWNKEMFTTHTHLTISIFPEFFPPGQIVDTFAKLVFQHLDFHLWTTLRFYCMITMKDSTRKFSSVELISLLTSSLKWLTYEFVSSWFELRLFSVFFTISYH